MFIGEHNIGIADLQLRMANPPIGSCHPHLLHGTKRFL
jgi:hypothetical protein